MQLDGLFEFLPSPRSHHQRLAADAKLRPYSPNRTELLWEQSNQISVITDPGCRWFLNLRSLAPLEYHSTVNHVKVDPGPWSSPGRRTYLSDGLMFPDSLDRLPLDLLSPCSLRYTCATTESQIYRSKQKNSSKTAVFFHLKFALWTDL